MDVECSRKIKALLIERGIKQAVIARDLRVSPSTVCKIVSGVGRSRRVEETIADLLGLKREKLWG